MIYIYTDGASRGNGGESAAAYIILDKFNKEIHKDVRHIGLTTNNMAEYMAVHDAIQYCYINVVYDEEGYTIISDSALVINQLNKKWKINNENLKELNKHINFYISNIKAPFIFEWRGREDPTLKLCDKMNNQCLDEVV